MLVIVRSRKIQIFDPLQYKGEALGKVLHHNTKHCRMEKLRIKAQEYLLKKLV